MRRLIVGFVALVLLGCADNAGPGGVPDAELHIVQQDSVTPPLVSSQATFWAKVGDGREVRLFYQVTPADSDEFLRFEVPGDGLLRKPDGTLFQTGDSIRITVTVLDPKRFSFQFEPSGLVFNPDHPARLKVRYFGCDHDFDGDGDLDSTDAAIEHELDLWMREGSGAPWFRMGAVKFEELDELDANIPSFTEHAVAW